MEEFHFDEDIWADQAIISFGMILRQRVTCNSLVEYSCGILLKICSDYYPGNTV